MDKLCPKCNISKPISDFAKNRNYKDGLEKVCKSCLKAYQQERRLKLQRITITEKRCAKCGITKPVAEFYRSSVYKDGYRCFCIACERENKANIKHIEVIEKQCNKCGIVKPISEYYRDRCNPDGHIEYCKDCHKIYSNGLISRPKMIKTEKKCLRCKEIKPISQFSNDITRKDGHKYYCKNCEDKYFRGEPMKKYQSEYQQTLKREVLTHYCSDGILKCADPYHVHKTPETDIDVLTLDHINGGGNKEFRETKTRLYVRVKRNNFPNGYQVLCQNCQIKKKLLNKEQPRTRRKKPEDCKQFYENNRLNIKYWNKKYMIKRKIEAFKHYSPNGIIQCADPFHRHTEPIIDIDVLCIDHINGNGHKHRLENNNVSLYLILRRSNYPDGFQVLCSSCNLKKRAVFKEYGHRKTKGE